MATRPESLVRPSTLAILFVLLHRLLALVYNGVNSSIDSLRGEHDTFGSMAAGAITGFLYKSTGAYSELSTSS